VFPLPITDSTEGNLTGIHSREVGATFAVVQRERPGDARRPLLCRVLVVASDATTRGTTTTQPSQDASHL
jgi:hypothetical protein